MADILQDGLLIRKGNHCYCFGDLIDRCTPELMAVLSILCKADAVIFMDAIEEGGVQLLELLYEFNREECETAITQLIKQKISFSKFLFIQWIPSWTP